VCVLYCWPRSRYFSDLVFLHIPYTVSTSCNLIYSHKHLKKKIPSGAPSRSSQHPSKPRPRTPPRTSFQKDIRSSTKRHERGPQESKGKGFNWEAEQLHDSVIFAVNTGLRPDEAWRLEFRDVTVVDDEDLGKTILEIEVRGKRGVGYCKSMPGVVMAL